jgi:hypothetical protein
LGALFVRDLRTPWNDSKKSLSHTRHNNDVRLTVEARWLHRNIGSLCICRHALANQPLLLVRNHMTYPQGAVSATLCADRLGNCLGAVWATTGAAETSRNKNVDQLLNWLN